MDCYLRRPAHPSQQTGTRGVAAQPADRVFLEPAMAPPAQHRDRLAAVAMVAADRGTGAARRAAGRLRIAAGLPHRPTAGLARIAARRGAEGVPRFLRRRPSAYLWLCAFGPSWEFYCAL